MNDIRPNTIGITMVHVELTCNSCKQTIVPGNPRVHCLVCFDYDLCANCMLGERFIQGHTTEHSIQVFKRSGGGQEHPVPASRYSISTLATPQYPPYYDQTSTALTLSRTSPHENGPAGWQLWFNTDSSPTPAFITLIDEIFTHLDPTDLGNLVPEVYSGFKDEMGCPPKENIWKSNLRDSYSNRLSAESMADKSLKEYYDLYSIDHALLQRIEAPGVRWAAPAGSMPAITRNGFLAIARINALSDPSREWGNFSRLLRKWDMPRYRGWGDLPRSVLPTVPDAAVLALIESAKAQEQRRLDALLSQMQMIADISRRGNEIALSAITGDRYVYERRYY